MTSAPICQFDNVRGLIKSAKLEGLLTANEWSDRVLGSTNDATATNDRLWCLTGNNVTFGGDMDRRVVTVSIDPGVERPEDRIGFAIPQLAAYVREHRTEILGALLTMIAAWDSAGRPMGAPTSDSFGVWISAIRGILKVCDVPGVFDHADSHSDAGDPDADEAASFLEAVEEVFGDKPWTTKDITDAMQNPANYTPTMIAAMEPERRKLFLLTEAFPTAARGKSWRHSMPYSELTRPLGYWMRNRDGQWFEGRRFQKGEHTKRGVEYHIERIER